MRLCASGGFFKDNPAAIAAVHGLLTKYANHPDTQQTCSMVLRLDDRITGDNTYAGKCILVRGIPTRKTPQFVWNVSVLGPSALWPEHLHDAKEPEQQTVMPLSMYEWNPPLSDEARYAASFRMYDLSIRTNVRIVYTAKDGTKHTHVFVPITKHTPENNPAMFPASVWSAIADEAIVIELDSAEHPVFE